MAVTTPEKATTYRHNALGQRVAKLVNGTVTEKYLWQDLTTLLAVYNPDDSVKQRFEYGLGHSPVSFTQGGQRYYIQTDHLGSPRVISNSSGTVVKAIRYDSYGNVISDSNPAFGIPFGFAGGLVDADTKLIRFGYRDYDPQTGRWTARDPIGFAGGDTNLYGYVLGDPVNSIDPLGLMEWNWSDFKAGYLQGVLDASQAAGNPNISGGANTCSGEYIFGKALGEGLVRGARSGPRVPTLRMSGGRAFEPNPKHSKRKQGKASPEPQNPQQTLENSIELPGNTTRRVGVDKAAGEFVVFDEHMPGKFHGYSRTWAELDQRMQATLRKAGVADKKGRIK